MFENKKVKKVEEANKARSAHCLGLPNLGFPKAFFRSRNISAPIRLSQAAPVQRWSDLLVMVTLVLVKVPSGSSEKENHSQQHERF